MLVALRVQSRWRLEGRARILSGPSPGSPQASARQHRRSFGPQIINCPFVSSIKVEYPKNIAHRIEHALDKFCFQFRCSGMYSHITCSNALLYGVNQFFGRCDGLTIRKQPRGQGRKKVVRIGTIGGVGICSASHLASGASSAIRCFVPISSAVMPIINALEYPLVTVMDARASLSSACDSGSCAPEEIMDSSSAESIGPCGTPARMRSVILWGRRYHTF